MPRIFLPILFALSMFVGSGEMIHACVVNDTGAVRIVGEGIACATGETALQWGVLGVQGPQGEPGPAGPIGPIGPTGPQGPAGIGDLGCATDQYAKWDDTQGQWVCGSLPDVTALQAEITGLKSQVAALQDLLQPVSRIENTLVISGANLQIVNGTGATDSTPNGLGNLIIGYNEERVVTETESNPVNERTGSHMLVVGKQHNYTSFGGIVVGTYNTTSGPFASVTGGYFNQATGEGSVVSGGEANMASGLAATVSGGSGNEASGYGATVSAGILNQATGRYSTVSGGTRLTANGVEEYLP